MHNEQSLLDKYCPQEIKKIIIYFTLVSDKSNAQERYKELRKTYPSISLINKEFHKHSEKILFVVCNDIVNELSKKALNEKDWRFKFCSKFKQTYGNYLYALQYDIYPSLKEKHATLTISDKQEFLRIVALYNSINAARLLLQTIDFDINYTDDNGSTFLSDAVSANSDKVTDLLLQRGANVDRLDNHNQSSLWHAFFLYMDRKCSLKIIELLLQYNADIHKKCRNNETTYEAAKRHESFLHQNRYRELMDLFDKYDKKIDTLQP